MNKLPITLAMASIIGISGPTFAATVEERLQRMEQRMQQLEQRVREQDAVIAEKEAQIAKLQEEDGNAGGGWFQNIELNGLVEVEGNSVSSDTAGGDSSDIAVATAEIGLHAQINDMTEAEISLLYEEDDTPLEVDVARIGIAPTDHVMFDFGQIYVPFGAYETQMISDPLTLEIGETRETVAMASFVYNGFTGGAYLFNGDTTEAGDDNVIDNSGLFASYAFEGNDFHFGGRLGYINDLSDSDTLQDTVGSTVVDSVGAYSASTIINTGPFTIIGEYLAASDNFASSELAFNGQGAEPSAFNVEAGFNFDLSGKEANVALGYQETEEAVGLGLPEKRVLAAFSVAIMNNTSLSFEVANDEDYSVADGGTGDDSTTVTGQLAVEF